MKFRIHKTSGSLYTELPPHELAIKDMTHPLADCEEGKFLWYVEIDSLNELIAITKSNMFLGVHEVVFSCNFFEGSQYSGEIEIYDDYRE